MSDDNSRKILGTVVCLPVRDLDASRAFYTEVFDLPDLTVEEGMITAELPNLSLFLIEEPAFESYSRKVGRGVNYPTTSSDVILSCAIESQKGLDDILDAASDNGGTVAKRGSTDNETGLYVGYFFDPDGHHWELAHSGGGHRPPHQPESGGTPSSDNVPDDLERQAERMADGGTVTYIEALEILKRKRGAAPLRPEREVTREAERRHSKE